MRPTCFSRRAFRRAALQWPLLALFAGCRADPTSTTDATANNSDWTEATHGKSATPNYSMVFPQETVNTLEITMTAAQWSAIRTNMRTLWGYDFGSGTTGTPGGGGGGFPTTDPDYVDVTLTFNGKRWTHVGFRLKGNSSLGTAWRTGNYKLPFRLNFDRFEDTYPSLEDQRFHGFKELSMAPGYQDQSLIREKVAADIFRLAGIPAARTAFYRVIIDFGSGPRYVGVYTMVEVIEDTMLESQFGDDDGNAYKPESRFLTFTQSEFEKKNNETAADYRDVQAFVAALNSPLRTTNASQWRTNLEAVFNVDHFLRYLAVNNVMVNWDVYGAMAHNYYLYNLPGKGLTWIPWDLNEALSGSPGITGSVSTGGQGAPGGNRGVSLSMNEPTAAQWPLLRFMADDAVYYPRYRQYVKQFSTEVFTPAAMNALFTKYHTLVAPHAVGSNGEQSGATYLTNATSFTNALSALQTHVVNRQNLVTSFVP